MTEKMRTEMPTYSATPPLGGFLSEEMKDYSFATGFVTLLGFLALSFVNCVLTNTRGPTLAQIGYILIIVGYLLVPGVAVILVRRNRCLTRNRILLMAETDIADSQFIDTFEGNTTSARSILGRREVMRGVEEATKCVIWGAADDKEEQCSVCLNDVEPGNEIRVLPCGHVFHKECADLWLVNGRKNTCPMCMQRVCPDRGPDMLPIQFER